MSYTLFEPFYQLEPYAMENTRFHIAVRLDKPQDWNDWYQSVKTLASELRLWDLINPDGDTMSAERIEWPKNPLEGVDLTVEPSAADIAKQSLEITRYQIQLQAYDSRDRALRELR